MKGLAPFAQTWHEWLHAVLAQRALASIGAPCCCCQHAAACLRRGWMVLHAHHAALTGHTEQGDYVDQGKHACMTAQHELTLLAAQNELARLAQAAVEARGMSAVQSRAEASYPNTNSATAACFLVTEYSLAERNLHLPAALLRCVFEHLGNHGRHWASFMRAGGLEAAVCYGHRASHAKLAHIVLVRRIHIGCGMLSVALCRTA